MTITRREALASLASALAAVGLDPAGALAEGADGLLDFADPVPFSFEILAARARDRARSPWSGVQSPHAALLERIDYDEFNQIRFREEAALWHGAKAGGAVQFFPLGKFFKEPAIICLVEDGASREIRYRRDYFDIPDGNPALELPDDAGYAGFRVMSPNQKGDWLAFLGASYFRSAGELNQYGLSARGIAVDTGLPTPEEFPRFTAFYLARGDEEGSVVVHAMLEGPSLTGAYRILCRHDGPVVMDVECRLFMREDVGRLGIAPLTSMYWYGQIDRHRSVDWRPQIHDSEGLAIWSGNGERVWRPLKNPPQVMTNSFLDDGLRGFGLLQRDRDFENYQDDGVFYERRPSLWVEPKGDWGRGAVQLLEIPTDDEIHDNIGAYWVSEKPARKGEEVVYAYRLRWGADEPYPSELARVANSFTGKGGIPGRPRPEGVMRFVVDFRGDRLEGLERGALLPEVGFSRGRLATDPAAYPVAEAERRWRCYFDLEVDGRDPVDLRLVLRDQRGAAASETWIYQFFPEQEMI